MPNPGHAGALPKIIDGLRVLPWWHEERRRSAGSPDPLKNCETCMRTNGELIRQTYGCGWLPPAPDRLRPLMKIPDPLAFSPTQDDDGNRLTEVCPGYLVALPQVIEAARARHWKHALRDFCNGKPTEHLMLCIEILDGACNDLSSWTSLPKSQGGGGS